MQLRYHESCTVDSKAVAIARDRIIGELAKAALTAVQQHIVDHPAASYRCVMLILVVPEHKLALSLGYLRPSFQHVINGAL